VVADATAPPWSAATFDVVLSRHVLWALPDAGQALDRWLDLLTPQGRLVIVDGRCWTGAGLAANDALALLRARGRDVSITMLDNPGLWGGRVSDERYLLVSH
jgi:SAM-dependent methyltransferase